MQKFKKFLTEKAEDPNYGLANDDKGKMHELLVGHFLMHGTNHDNPSTHVPQRALPKFPQRPAGKIAGKKETKSKAVTEDPEELHDHIKAKLSPDNYGHHVRIAKFTAHHILKGLEEGGHISSDPKSNSKRITNVHWTSRPSDIQKLHGSADPANTSDIVLQKKAAKLPMSKGRDKKKGLVVETDGGPKEGGEHIGISLKIHNSPKTSTLANPGRGSMDSTFLSHAKVKNTDRFENQALEAAHAAAEAHGVKTRSMSKIAAHKAIKIGGTSKKAEKIRDQYHPAAKAALDKIAGTYRDSMMQHNPHHLGNLLRKIANVKPTSMKMYKSATYGTSNLTHHFDNPSVEMESILKQHEGHIKVEKGSGTSIRFSGKNGTPIGSIAVKYGSSTPHTGVVGSMQGWSAGAKASVEPHVKKEVAKKMGY